MRVGTLLAAGQDCDVYEAGTGKVIRRARDGRSLEREASVMRHARRQDFPAPEVFDADGADILMERIVGVSVSREATRRPWRAPAYGRLLVELLQRLATVRAPGWLPAAEGAPGNNLLHLDLHPGNVLVTADGPRVIDWANAGRGAPAADVACTWLIIAAAPVSGPVRRAGRVLMAKAFADAVDRPAVLPYLTAMAERRRDDDNTHDAERAAIDRLLARETATSSPRLTPKDSTLKENR
ncbi:phosphotransferase [Nonomuraea aurantiaca]|uniref:phosphotransferase n=1 Tax=Nonomuraea aurantiaca TaxID=2878562 RepID=UPI001CD91CC3|nr:phosphotransferase [Nonomuraea aurantiaca]MCA2221005.1 phosphotransferase [Nonomuraea aurantiaca]